MSDKNKQLDWYYKRRLKMINYLHGECIRCGESRIEFLDIHHVNPEEKSFTLSTGYSLSWNKIVVELDKCVLLCNDCHKEEHAPPHGSLSRYKHWKCRCILCVRANTFYTREYRKR